MHAVLLLIHHNFSLQLMFPWLQTVRNFAFVPVRVRSYYPKVDQYRNGMEMRHMTTSIYGPRSKFSPALTVISQSLFEPVDFWYFKHPCNLFYVFIISLIHNFSRRQSVIVIVKQNYEWAIWRRAEAIIWYNSVWFWFVFY